MTSPSDDPAALTFAERANFYQTLSIRTFPVVPGGKIPLKKIRWREDATTDWEQLKRWSQETPDANVGVVTGEIIDVIDCDTERAAIVFAQEECAYDGDDISGALAAIINVYGNCVVTPRGVHIYVRPTAGAHNTVHAQLRVPAYAAKLTEEDGIDYRGDGGYVVGAGSHRPEGDYIFYGDSVGAVPAPSWLTMPDEPARQQPTLPAPTPEVRASAERERRAFEVVLEKECCELRLVKQGERHKRTLSAALRVGGLLYDASWREEARRALIDAARATGYSKSEAETTVDDGLDHASQNLRVLPDRPMAPAPAPAPEPADEVKDAAEVEDTITPSLPPHERVAEGQFSTSDLLAVARHFVASDFFGPAGSWVVYSADGNWYRRDAECVWRVTSAAGQGDRTLYDEVLRALPKLTVGEGKPFPCTPELTGKIIQALPTAAAEGGHCVPAPQETHYWTTDEHPGGDWFLCPGGKLFSPWSLSFIDCPGNYWAESLELAITPEAGPTPVWDEAFREVGLDDDAYRRLDQICALACFGKNSRIEKIPILFGPGGCGKTVIMHLLAYLLGDVAAEPKPEELAQQFNGSTATKRVILLDDKDKGAVKLSEMMLSHGGGVRHKVSVQLKHKESIDRYVAQRWIFACNALPSIPDVGGRQQRRWWVLPFERKAPRMNIHLLEQLQAEGPALLWRWASVYARLQEPEQIVPLPYDAELARVIRGNSNPVAQWVEERLEPVPVGRTFCSTARMLSDYKEWAKRSGITYWATARELRAVVTEWAQTLEVEPRAVDGQTGKAERPHYTRCDNVRGWFGIGLRSQMETTEHDDPQG